MQVIWLGHGGLVFVSGKKKILINPYLSNSLRLVDKEFRRKIKIKNKLFRIVPDVIILSNSRPEFSDQKTLTKFLNKKSRKKITVLACENAYTRLFKSKSFKNANPIMFGEGDEWTLDTLHIRAVMARCDDTSAFGLVITDSTDNRQYYIASSTLYNEKIFDSLPLEPFAAFLPISGKHGCMNVTDAIRFACKLDAEFNVPINYGMFDDIDPTEFKVPGKVFPKPNRAIEFNIIPVQSVFAPKVFDGKFNERVLKPKPVKIDTPPPFSEGETELAEIDLDTSPLPVSHTDTQEQE